MEAACALGLADGIVDLVESGETMRACGLTAISTLLSSQAVLIKSATPHERSTRADPAHHRTHPRRHRSINKYVLCQYNVQKKRPCRRALEITPGRRAATVSPLEDKNWNAVSSMVLKADVATIMESSKRSAPKTSSSSASTNAVSKPLYSPAFSPSNSTLHTNIRFEVLRRFYCELTF